MRLWLCLLLLCAVAGRAVADDDVEGGVLDAGPPVPWRVTVDMTTKWHQVVQNGPDAAIMTNDLIDTMKATYVVQVPSGLMAGPNYGFGFDSTDKTVISRSGGGDSSGRGTLDTGREKLTGESRGTLVSANITFRYNDKRKTFDASITARYHTTGHDGTGKKTEDTGPIVIQLGNMIGKPIGTVRRDGKKITIVDDSAGKDASGSHHEQHVLITIEPMQDSKYIAVLVPAKREVYATWVPLGPTIPGDDETKGGNDLELVLQIRDKATNKPVPVHYTATWTIEGTRLPGWCMNYPKKSAANDHWDLYFDPNKNKGHTLDNDGEQLHVNDTSGDVHATVSSRDYGGHAIVQASVTLADGTSLAAREDKGDSIATDPGIRVPKDDNQNHIADAWENDHHLTGKDATDDDDPTPAGMFNKGDGLDVFEEYRGFAILDPKAVTRLTAANKSVAGVKPVLQRLDPNVKELFVVLEGGPIELPALAYGALRFGVVTGITIYVVDREHVEPMAHDSDASHPRTLTTRIDPADADFGEPQAAVWVTTNMQPWSEGKLHTNAQGKQTKIAVSDSMGYTPFLGDEPVDAQAKHHGSPTQVTGVEIFPSNVINEMKLWIGWFDSLDRSPFTRGRMEALAKAHPDWHLTAQSLQQYANAHFAELEQELIAWTAMHELGHAVGGRHHRVDDYVADKVKKEEAFGSGDAQCPMRYWHYADPGNVILFLSGHWKLLDDDADGMPWKFGSEDWPDMRVWQKPEEIDQRGKH